MAHDFLQAGVENSQSQGSIKEETLKILDEAKEIRDRLSDEQAQKEYEELRLATVAALVDLRASTHDELESVKAGLWDGSIDVYSYSQWSIDGNELQNIQREFEDLQRMGSKYWEWSIDSTEVNSELLDTIRKTNADIIAGWPNVLWEQLDWYENQYWKLSIIQAITDKDYDSIIQDISKIRTSSDNIYTKLFKLSQVIYSANNSMSWIAKTAISAWYGWNFEETHNYATRDIVRKVIGNSENTFTVWFTPERWYYVNEWKLEKNNSMEVGTFLCSLNKSWTLTRENLLEPNGPFSATELFDLIKDYKQGNFGGPEVQWLFTGYLSNFEENMEKVAEDYLASEQNGAHIIDFLNAQSDAENEMKIYTSEDIPTLYQYVQWEDLSTFKNKELKEAFMGENAKSLWADLKEQLRGLYEWWPEILDIVDAIIDFSINAEEWDSLWFNYNGINNEIMEYNRKNRANYPLLWKKIQEQIKEIFGKSSLEKNYTIPKNSIGEVANEMQELYKQRQELYSKIRVNERMWEYEVSNTLRQEIEEIDTKLWLLQDRKKELLSITDEINLSNIQEIENIHFDFNNPAEVDSILENRKYIKYISNPDDLLLLIEKSWASIKFHEVHSKLQTNIQVLRALNNIDIFDIYRMPDTFFSFQDGDNQSAYGKVFVLLESVSYSYASVINAFKQGNSPEVLRELADYLYLIIKDQDNNLNEFKRERIKKSLLKQDELMVFLDTDKKEELWYVPGIAEENNDNAREVFNNTAKRMFEFTSYMNTWAETKRKDRSIIVNYLLENGFSEVKDTFINLIRKENIIKTYWLWDILSNMEYSEENIKIILSGIESRGGEIIKPLNDKFKSHPSVIEAILKKTDRDKWDNILPYININSSRWILALYRASGNSVEEVVKYLDMKGYGSEELKQIIEGTVEKNLSLMSRIIDEYNKSIVIQEIWGKTKIVKSNVEASENTISHTRAFLEEYNHIFPDTEAFLIALKTSSWINEELWKEIHRAFRGNPEEITVFTEWLLSASAQDAQEELERQQSWTLGVPRGSKLEEIIEFNEYGEFKDESWENISKRFKDFRQSKNFENIEEAQKAYLEFLWVEERSEDYHKITEYLATEEAAVKAFINIEKSKEIATAITYQDWEELESIQDTIDNKYLSGELSYLPQDTNKENKNSNEVSDNNSSSPEIPSFFSPITERVSFWENGNYILSTNTGEIPITPTDLTALDNNPEAEANFIEFYNTLQKLNLEEFWNYKDIIFQAISNSSATSGLNLNDKWYIDKSDMALFLYTIADSVSESPHITDVEKNDINSMRGQKQDYDLIYSMIERVNRQTGLAKDGDQSVLRWNEWRLWKIFREMYFSKDNDKNTQSLLFKKEDFQKNIWK